MTSSAAAAARLARVPGTATSLGRGRHAAPPSPATALRDKATADQCWPAIASTAHLAKSLSYLIHKYENIFFNGCCFFQLGGNVKKLEVSVNLFC